MAHEVVREWEAHGLDCAVLHVNTGYGAGHLCGYVRVPEGHPWFGKGYDAEVEGAAVDLDDMSVQEAYDDLGVINVFAHLLSTAADDEEGENRLSRISMRVRVHGGVTYAGEPYFGDEKGWCFGFDTAHADDSLSTCPAEYVEKQAERMAEQIAGYGLVESLAVSEDQAHD